MPVALDWEHGERRREKENDEQSCLRPAQKWVVDQKSWSPLGRQVMNVGNEEINNRIESGRNKDEEWK